MNLLHFRELSSKVYFINPLFKFALINNKLAFVGEPYA